MWNPISILSHVTSLKWMLAAPSPGWWGVFSAAKTYVLTNSYCLADPVVPARSSKADHKSVFAQLCVLLHCKFCPQENEQRQQIPGLQCYVWVVLLCLQLILTENLPAGPQPHTTCFLSSESAFWHCLRHPGRSAAKGLWVLLPPLFLGDSASPLSGAGWGRVTNLGENGLWAALDLLKFQGNFAAYFMKKKYSSIWSSLICIKQIFLLQALCCLWCIHKNYIQHVKI